MKNEDMIQGIGEIDEQLIEEAANLKSKEKPQIYRFIRPLAILAACVLAAFLSIKFINISPKIQEQEPTTEPSPTSPYRPITPFQPQNPGVSHGMPIKADTSLIQVKANELSAAYERVATDEGMVSAEFVSAMIDFAMTLYTGSLNPIAGNQLISPLSAIMCLSMVANGTQGESRAQFEKMIGMSVDELNTCIYSYSKSIQSSKYCTLNLANSIWFNTGSNIKANPTFLQTNADWYQAKLYEADFALQSTVDDINNWCLKNTDGMIEKIIDGDCVGGELLILNALFFDAAWDDKYRDWQVTSGTFNNYDGSTSPATYLSSTEIVYLEGDGIKGFTKAYEDTRYSFMALLPDENQDIYDFAIRLTGAKWMELFKNSSREYLVDVKMPEFKYEDEIDLAGLLKAQGLTAMFGFEGYKPSDFEPTATGESPLLAMNVFQKTIIDVNKDGTRAAAITGIKHGGLPSEQKHKEVILDRPFVYAIIDNQTGIPFFVGILDNLA